MVTAASDKRMRRRGGRRRQTGPTPADVGTALREARQTSGALLPEIQDRTGVPEAQLEALENGNLSRFHDLRSAVTAVRRYSDLVHVDLEPFDGVLEEHWGTALAGFDSDAPDDAGRANGGRPPRSYLTTGSVPASHLSRYPGDGTHLRAFTQTDEVPGVRRAERAAANDAGGNGHGSDTVSTFAVTGSFPAHSRPYTPPRSVSLLLRGAIWLTTALLVVALIGLAMEHYDPRLLADIHVVHHPTTTTTTTPGAAAKPGSPSHPSHPSIVTLVNTGVDSASVNVQASNYSVVVAAWAPCWTVVHSPQSFSPVFAATLAGGQVKNFVPANGQLSVSMSAALVTVQVKVGNKIVPGFLFKPTSVPFTLDFASTST